jgi:hypothetical protein
VKPQSKKATNNNNNNNNHVNPEIESEVQRIISEMDEKGVENITIRDS